jgi:biopolymer transport protein ExbD
MIVSGSAFAQKPRKPVVKKPVFTVPTREDPVVSGDRFFFVITLDKDGNATTSLQNENGPALTPAQSTMFFTKLSRIGDTRLAPAVREALAPGVIIRSDRSLKYETLVKAARTARDPSNLRVMAATDDDTFYLGIPEKPDQKIVFRPNVLRLLLTLDNEDLLYVNGEPHGWLSDPSEFERFLKQIFKARADNGVYRVGTNVVDTTVFFCLRDNSTVADLMKLVKVVRNAGSDTIGLDIDPRETVFEIRATPRTR